MNNQNLPDNPDVVVQKANKTGLFTNYIYKAIPLAFDESMSYYETLCGLLNYLQNTIIPTVNNNADAVSELQNLYIELKTYVDDYFTNLDVQQEINNKLDAMVEDGSLTLLIKNYVDPIYQSYENSINAQVDLINTKVDSVASGSPLVASSTSEMTDTTRVYVNTTDGKWYYYDGDSWEIGGTYQSTELANGSVTFPKLANNVNDYLLNNITLNYIKDGYKSQYSQNPILFPIKIPVENMEVIATDKYLRSNLEYQNSSGAKVYKYELDDDVYAISYHYLSSVPGSATFVGYENDGDDVIVSMQLSNSRVSYLRSYCDNTHKADFTIFNYLPDYQIDYIIIYKPININNDKQLIQYTDKIINPFQYIRNDETIVDSTNQYCFSIAKLNLIPFKKYYYEYQAKRASTPVDNMACCYDVNDVYLGYVSKSLISSTDNYYIYEFSIPYANCDYIKLNVWPNTILYTKEEKEEKHYFQTRLNKPFNFDGNINVFGDSIVAGSHASSQNKRWTNVLASLNSITITNNGHSGDCFTDDITGHNQILPRLQNATINEDTIIIAGGVNDFLNGATLGSITDTEETTFYGALNTMATYLNTNYSDKNIIFITPIFTPLTIDPYTNTPSINPLSAYCEAIYNVCIKNGYSVISGYDLGFPTIQNSLTEYVLDDELHPNDTGYKLYAYQLNSILH